MLNSFVILLQMSKFDLALFFPPQSCSSNCSRQPALFFNFIFIYLTFPPVLYNVKRAPWPLLLWLDVIQPWTLSNE